MAKKTRDETDPELVPITNIEDWDVVPAEEAVSVASRLGSMISVRFDPDAARSVRRAARANGLTQSEFIRRAALAMAEEVIGRQPVDVVAPGGEAPPITWAGGRATVARPRVATTSMVHAVSDLRMIDPDRNAGTFRPAASIAGRATPAEPRT